MKKLLVIAVVMLCAFSACKKEELPQGSFEAKFSIADERQVTFSKGNLQYNVAEKYWRFAEHQYDFIGLDNENIGTSNAEWIDLFGWGTSCYLQGAKCYVVNDYYQPQYDNGKLNLNHENGADWGVNCIRNGGNAWDMWHTLNDLEWEYIMFYRKDADQKCCQAFIDGIRFLCYHASIFLIFFSFRPGFTHLPWQFPVTGIVLKASWCPQAGGLRLPPPHAHRAAFAVN